MHIYSNTFQKSVSNRAAAGNAEGGGEGGRVICGTDGTKVGCFRDVMKVSESHQVDAAAAGVYEPSEAARWIPLLITSNHVQTQNIHSNISVKPLYSE